MKYVLAIAIASGALFGLSAQAAPVSPEASAVQSQVATGVEKVMHCRHWSRGWHCSPHTRSLSHRRRGSYRR
jgi:hypothetical protein